MRVLAAALLAALVLAGCTTPPADPVPPPPPPVLEPPAFAAAVALPQTVGGGEPNIAILPDGTLFVTAPAGGALKPNAREGAAHLWRSRDDGKTWDVLRSPSVASQGSAPLVGGAFCSCDADVTGSPDGWVYYSDWWIAGLLGPGNYLVEASSDGGQTWTANSVPIPQNIAASMDRQWLVAGPDGFVALFYSFFGSTPAGSPPVPAAGIDRPGQAIEAVYSQDHGATWTDPAPVVAASQDGLQIGHPFLAANGTLMMAYGRTAPGQTFFLDPSAVHLAWSTDLGMTWHDSRIAEVPLGFDNLWAVQGATDASTGQSTLVWAGRLDGVEGGEAKAGSRMGLWVYQFGPLGTVGPVLVRSDGTNFLPWASARAGRTAVGWYGGDATGDVRTASGDAQWFPYVAAAPDGLFTPGGATVSRVSDAPVKTGPICPKGAACSGDRELLDYVSLVHGADGRLHYAFAKSDAGEGFVQVANQA